jgi:anti-sigma factor RsiW
MLTCREIVTMVTDYLDGGLDQSARLAFERHVAICPPCRAHFAQMRRTIETTGLLTVSDVSPEAELSLRNAFRHWKAGGGS